MIAEGRNRSALRTGSRRRVEALVIAVLLAGCTGSADSPGTSDTTGGDRPPIGEPTVAAQSTDPTDEVPDGVDPEDLYPDPLIDNEVVYGRSVNARSFPAIWPETSYANLALAQLATLEGRERWRLSPKVTAERFAVEVLGWERDDVRSTVLPPKHPWWPMCTVEVWSTEEPGGIAVKLSMFAFGPWGSDYRWRSSEPGTAWSVQEAETELLALDALFDQWDPTVLRLAGAVRIPDPSSVEVRIDIFEGAIGRSAIPLPGGVTSLGEGHFRAQGEVVSTSGDRSVALAVTLTDRRTGGLLGLKAIPLGSPRTADAAIPDHPNRRIWPVASDWYVSPEVASASGSGPWRASATETVERFAVEVLGWAHEDVGTLMLDGWNDPVVGMWNERVADGERRPHLHLVKVFPGVVCISGTRFGCNGFNPSDSWTVASLDGALVELEQARMIADGSLLIEVSFAGETDSRHLELQLSDGAAGAGPSGWIRLEGSSEDPGRSLSVWSIDGSGWITALVSVVDDATGIRLAADAFPIEIHDEATAAD
jgi:hypothetical protein